MPAAVPLVLIPPLGCSAEIWEGIALRLSSHRTIVRVDLPGHGTRLRQRTYPTTLAALVQDTLQQVADKVPHAPVWDVAGLSIGGLIALGLAHASGSKVRRMVLANSALYLPASSHAAWRQRAARACHTGMDSIVEGTLSQCFTAGFRASQRSVCASVARQLCACDGAAYAALTEVLVATDLRAMLREILQPSLVVTAAGDAVFPARLHEALLARLPHAHHSSLPGAHFAPLEHAALFACAVAAFLDETPSTTAKETV